MKNQRGFLLVELVISFAFVIIVVMVALQAAFLVRDRHTEEILNTEVTTFKMNLFELLHDDLEELNTVAITSSGSGAIINGKTLSFNYASNEESYVTFGENRLILTRDTNVLYISDASCKTIAATSSFSCTVEFGGIGNWNPFVITIFKPGVPNSS